MLDKLINNLKQSLPEPLRKKLGGEEQNNDEDHSEEENEDSHDTSDNEKDSSDADAKKKRISMIIRVIVVIGLGYLALDQFVLKSDQQNAPEIANIPTKPRKSRKKPPVVATDSKDAKASDTKPEEKKDEAAKTTAPVENVNITEKTDDKTADKTEEKKPEEEVTAPVVEKTIVPENKMGEAKNKEAEIDKKIDSMIDSVDSKENNKEATKEKVGSSADGAPKKEVKLEDMIATDDTYTAPPAYDQLGRGLVYNCKEKYWACVDKVSYVACNKNMKWNRGHTKPIECVVQNVYNSDDDCGVVQKYNVSTNKETSFCQ